MNVIDEILNNYKNEKYNQNVVNLGNSISDLKREIGMQNNPYTRWGQRKPNKTN